MAKKLTSKKTKKRDQSLQSVETFTIEQAYEIAVKHFRNNNLQQAELVCREILKVAPNYSSALDMLGIVSAKAGKLDEAEELIKKAIEIAPHEQSCHRNLAVVHHLRKKTQLASIAVNESPKVKTQSWKKLVHCFLSFPVIPQLNHSNIPFDIIIPIYNGLNFLTKLLPLVLKNTKIPYRLILIDDASTDENIILYLNQVAQENPHVILIRNESNLGFLLSVNKAYQLVKNHFVILNQDTEVPPYWLERLLYPIVTYHNIASTTPFTNAGTICSFPITNQDNELFLGLSVTECDHFFQYFNPINHFIELPTGVGFCMGINKQIADEIGMFDADNFGRGYGEENDWCMRASKLGYQNIIVPNLFVYHKHGGSFSTTEKQMLMDKNLATLFKLHPEYSGLVTEFIMRDPLRNIRQFLIILISTHQAQEVLLIIDHENGGGANHFSERLINQSIANNKIVMSFSYNTANQVYRFTYRDAQQQFELLFDTFTILETLFSLFHITALYINELVTFQQITQKINILIAIKRKFNPKLVIYIHDYFMICPSYHLLNHQEQFCNIPPVSDCHHCLQSRKEHDYLSSGENISTWRDYWGKFLQCADQVICFSNSSKILLKKAYPNLEENIIVAPHVVDYIAPVKFKCKLGTINIGVLGAIGHHKGLGVLTSMITLIEKHNYDVNIVVIGYTSSNIRSDKIIVTGKYTHEQLPNLVVQHNIACFFIPSVCPETFCYTAEEIMLMEMPLAVFDLGAPAERVRRYEKGLIIDKIDAKYALEQLLKFSREIT